MLSLFSHVQLFVILWTVACQASLSMGLSRQDYWSGLVAMLSSRISYQLNHRTLNPSTYLLCLLSWQAVLHDQRHLGSPIICTALYNHCCNQDKELSHHHKEKFPYATPLHQNFLLNLTLVTTNSFSIRNFVI